MGRRDRRLNLIPLRHLKPELQIEGLAANRNLFRWLLEPVSPEIYRWRPAASSWSLLEVVCHLYDEEREDFRTRTRLALNGGKGDFHSIRPVQWVREREYHKQDFVRVREEFLKERSRSVRWLRSLQSPDWDAAFEHRELGRMSARKMLANWLAHDYHHIRQINALNYAFLRECSGEDLSYAGNWKP